MRIGRIMAAIVTVAAAFGGLVLGCRAEQRDARAEQREINAEQRRDRLPFGMETRFCQGRMGGHGEVEPGSEGLAGLRMNAADRSHWSRSRPGQAAVAFGGALGAVEEQLAGSDSSAGTHRRFSVGPNTPTRLLAGAPVA